MNRTKDELERFREQWKAEVSTKKHQTQPTLASSSQAGGPSSSATGTINFRKSKPEPKGKAVLRDGDDELAPQPYHDLEEKELGRKLGDESYGTKAKPEPTTALEHYERAVEKEGQGNLGDSVRLYSKAFKVIFTLSHYGDMLISCSWTTVFMKSTSINIFPQKLYFLLLRPLRKKQQLQLHQPSHQLSRT